MIVRVALSVMGLGVLVPRSPLAGQVAGRGRQVVLEVERGAAVRGTLVGSTPEAYIVRSPCLPPFCSGTRPVFDTIPFNNVRAAFYRWRPPVPVSPVSGAVAGALVGGTVGLVTDSPFRSRAEQVGSRLVLGALAGAAIGWSLEQIWPRWRQL